MLRTSLNGAAFCLLLLIPALALPAAASELVRVQLLANGGCEDPLVGGNIPLWTEVTGSNWTQRGANPEPYAGDHYFFPGVAATAELRQDVDVSDYALLIDSGGANHRFTGYLRSYSQSPVDQSRIVLEYRSTDGTVLLTLDSGLHSNTSIWEQILWESEAPIGTRTVRVRLISTRRSGSNNDGYYDGLTLSALADTPQNVTIARNGVDISLDWDPVTHDPYGAPISISAYKVYADDTLEISCSPSHLVGTVGTPGLLLPGIAATAEQMFLRVIAVRQ